LRDPVLETSWATGRTHFGTTQPTGLANRFDIDVPEKTTSLALDLQAKDKPNTTFELYVYDCTSGEGFSYNFTVPAADRQTLVIRHPNPGRWVAAVNAAPFPIGGAHFDLTETLSTETSRHPVRQEATRLRGARWTQTIERPAPVSSGSDETRALIVELIDAA